MPAAIYTHPDFNAADADVTFQSSDGIQFHVHRKYLEANTGAFPGSEFDTRGEVTHLTEDSETLAILFQFVYPRRHPTLQDMGFATLMPVAEAVEKYQVFSAMNTCEMRLRRFVPEHPIEILVHGVKHDYRELREDTFPFIARMPFVKTAPLLPVSFLHPWIQYNEAWKSIFAAARGEVQGWHPHGSNCSGPAVFQSQSRCFGCATCCWEWLHVLENITGLPELRAELKNHKTVDDERRRHCSYCTSPGDNMCMCLREVAKVVEKGVASIPLITHFLGGGTWAFSLDDRKRSHFTLF